MERSKKWKRKQQKKSEEIKIMQKEIEKKEVMGKKNQYCVYAFIMAISVHKKHTLVVDVHRISVHISFNMFKRFSLAMLDRSFLRFFSISSSMLRKKHQTKGKKWISQLFAERFSINFRSIRTFVFRFYIYTSIYIYFI